MRSGYDDALLPGNFDDAAHARDWLPIDWHPDQFDVEETNAALAIAVAEPVAVTGELAELAEQLDHRGIRLLREVLGRPFSHGPTDVSDVEAARLTETYRTFLDVIGDGVTLTAAGYLPPAVVEQVAERSGISEWWIGKANREDLTYPVAEIRTTARALGLVSVRKGRLSPTAAAARCAGPAGAVAAHRRSPSRWAPRTPSARRAGWHWPWPAAAYRLRSGAARSATCSSLSGGRAGTTGSHRRRQTAQLWTSSSSSPVRRASAGGRSRASTSPSRPPRVR